jgi:hypothetical protein
VLVVVESWKDYWKHAAAMGVKIPGATAAGALGGRKDVTECLTDCSAEQNFNFSGGLPLCCNKNN